MKTILLSQNRVAVVDDEDFGFLNRFQWHAHRGNNGRWYAARRESIGRKLILMHRLILLTSSECVDHRNGDGLDNRKENLRVCSHSQNLANSRARAGNFKGVYGPFGKKRPRWRAHCGTKYLGTFGSAEEAAKAFDASAKKQYGEFAFLNFPEK